MHENAQENTRSCDEQQCLVCHPVQTQSEPNVNSNPSSLYSNIYIRFDIGYRVPLGGNPKPKTQNRLMSEEVKTKPNSFCLHPGRP